MKEILERIGLPEKADSEGIITRAMYMADGVFVARGNTVEESEGYAAARILIEESAAMEPETIAAALVTPLFMNAAPAVVSLSLPHNVADIVSEAGDVINAIGYDLNESREYLRVAPPAVKQVLMALATARLEEHLSLYEKLPLESNVPHTPDKDGNMTTRTVAAAYEESIESARNIGTPSLGKTDEKKLEARFVKQLAAVEAKLGLGFGKALAFNAVGNPVPGRGIGSA